METKDSGKTSTLAAKINRILILSLGIGLGIIAIVFAYTFTASRQVLSRRSLEQEADLLYTAIENFMLPGEAPLAVKFFDEVALANPVFRISLYRRDGITAFSDNTTITIVNRNIMRERFPTRTMPALGKPMAPDAVQFPKTVALPPEEVFFRFKEGDKTFVRMYRPLINLPKCTACHGSDHTIRGVLDVQSDVSSLVRAEQLTVAASGAGFLAFTAILSVVMSGIMRKGVANPVAAIGRVCARVAAGDFGGVVDVRGNDEIGRLGRQVNDMVSGLRERYELTKYVSAGTIGAIQSTQEPKRVPKTLLFTDVRGFTSYTGSHEAERVVGILNKLLEEQSRIIHDCRGDVDKFVGDEVVAVFTGEDGPARACTAALQIMDAARLGKVEFDGLSLGAGIACGDVIQGMIGSARRADFTVIGASVNIAARLCALAKPGQILVAKAARDVIGQDAGFTFRGPYKTALKGIDGPSVIFILANEGGAA